MWCELPIQADGMAAEIVVVGSSLFAPLRLLRCQSSRQLLAECSADGETGQEMRAWVGEQAGGGYELQLDLSRADHLDLDGLGGGGGGALPVVEVVQPGDREGQAFIEILVCIRARFTSPCRLWGLSASKPYVVWVG